MFNFNTRTFGAAVAALSVLAAAATASAEDKLRVTGGEVTVVCPLTVGGSFEAKTKAVSGQVVAAEQPGQIAGALEVKLDTLETGIGMRDRHMRENYLEVSKGADYQVAVLDNIRIDKADGKGTFHGTLTLHGQKREVVGTSSIQKKDGGVHVDAQFPLKVSEFQIPKTTYLGVGVQDEIQIKVSIATAPVQSVASNR